MIEIIGVFIAYTMVTTVVNLTLMGGCQTGWQWINPVVIYHNVPVNLFGCFVLTILAHIAAGPIFAVGYWFYKLCTFGRKWEDD